MPNFNTYTSSQNNTSAKINLGTLSTKARVDPAACAISCKISAIQVHLYQAGGEIKKE